MNAEPLGMTINRGIIAEEIVRTLVGSVGLLAGVPLTSLIAALVAQRRGGGTGGPSAKKETEGGKRPLED
jgi:uncharacterized membrane protein